MSTYDAFPYPSYSYPKSTPASMYAISQLFGRVPANIKTARVLELGCASGGNIIPLAARFTDSEFLGVDISNVQIKYAQQRADELSLKNIVFEEASILDLNLDNKQFDYIIVHGVYSWVSTDVQNKILEICSQNLGENGVAYISYNTLPGWNSVKTIRDMMLYHGQNFDDDNEKANEARRLLDFVSDNIQATSGAYKETLEKEIASLKQHNNNYLLHDHLEAVNEPCYLYEFAEKASVHGLVYLGDADLPSMYIGNQTQIVAETLAKLDDTVRQEQYLDFITNRRYRMTLLVKQGAALNRNLLPENLDGLRFIANCGLKQPLQPGTENTLESIDLVSVNNPEFSATLRGKSACVCYIEMLKAAPVALTAHEIIDAAHEILLDVPKEEILNDFNALVLKQIFTGTLTLTADIPSAVKKISEKPEALKATRIEGLAVDMLTNTRHETIKVSADQRVVLQYLDGAHSIEDIENATRTHIDKGELVISVDGKPLDPESDQFEASIAHYIQMQLSFFLLNAFLVA